MQQHMLQGQGSKEERKLCKIYKNLNEVDQQTLLSFADFLNNRDISTAKEVEPISSTPLDIPRPEKESVIKAIRRLSETYPMIDKDSMFDQTSKLMTSHVMEGRSAESVIDELEELFTAKYKDFTNG